MVVVCRRHYIGNSIEEFDGTRAYKETDSEEITVVNAHLNDLPVTFSVCVNEGHDKLPRYIGYLSFIKDRIMLDLLQILIHVTPLNFFKLLTSCVTAIKSHVRYCETVYETSNKTGYGQKTILARCLVN